MTAIESFRETCLRMMRVLTPHGSEKLMLPLLPEGVGTHPGCYFKLIRNGGEMPSTIWSSHLDVACCDADAGKEVNFRFSGNTLHTDNKTILGADCKTGAAMMVTMANAGVPGLYVWHFGEERGGIGAKLVTADEKAEEMLKQFKYCIALDRRGYDSVITHQGGDETCSNEFATELAARLCARPGLSLYKPDRTGSYTDSKEYRGLVPECTNLSVGYFNQHCNSESQNLVFAENLLSALLDPTLTADLPVRREPKIVRYLQYSNGNYCGSSRHSYRSRYDPDTRTWKEVDEEADADGPPRNIVVGSGTAGHAGVGVQSAGHDRSGKVVCGTNNLATRKVLPGVNVAEMNTWPPLHAGRSLSCAYFIARYKASRCFIVSAESLNTYKEYFKLRRVDYEASSWFPLGNEFCRNVIVYDPITNTSYINLAPIRYVEDLGWCTNKGKGYAIADYPERIC